MITFTVNTVSFSISKQAYDEFFLLSERSDATDILQNIDDYDIDVNDTSAETIKWNIQWLLDAIELFTKRSIQRFIGGTHREEFMFGAYTMQSLDKPLGWLDKAAAECVDPEIILHFVDKYIKEPRKFILRLVPETSWILRLLKYQPYGYESQLVEILRHSVDDKVSLQIFRDQQLYFTYSAKPKIYTIEYPEFYDTYRQLDKSKYNKSFKFTLPHAVREYIAGNKKTVCMIMLHAQKTHGKLILQNKFLEAYLDYVLDINEFYDNYYSYVDQEYDEDVYMGRPYFYPSDEEMTKMFGDSWN